MTVGSIRSDDLKKHLTVLCGLLMLLMPLHVSAASVGDVYAALRDIGVPEEYVSQAAGVLARGTSDGAGVYRSDGSYYSYSDMVGYIYANRELILSYCGLDGEQEAAATSETMAESGTSNAVTDAVFSVSAYETQITTSSAAETASSTQTVKTTQTETTVLTQISDAAAEEHTSHSGWGVAVAFGCIFAAAAGFGWFIRLLKKQESV